MQNTLAFKTSALTPNQPSIICDSHQFDDSLEITKNTKMGFATDSKIESWDP